MSAGQHAPVSDAAAFFDVDETLITVKSMFSFLEFYLRRNGEPDSTYQRLSGELHAAAAGGLDRTQVNRRYYRLYAGESAKRLSAVGEEWFADRLTRGLFVTETVNELLLRRQAGDFIALVSGSFFACLDPISSALQVDWVLSTRPVVKNGLLTGRVVTPMIGAAKGRAAQVTASVLGLDLASSSAYGDHISDLDLLRSVGRPVVVGASPELVEYAELAGWQRLATDLGSRQTLKAGA